MMTEVSVHTQHKWYNLATISLGIQFDNGSSIKIDEDEGNATICISRTGSTQFPLQISITYTSISATGM